MNIQLSGSLVKMHIDHKNSAYLHPRCKQMWFATNRLCYSVHVQVQLVILDDVKIWQKDSNNVYSELQLANLLLLSSLYHKFLSLLFLLYKVVVFSKEKHWLFISNSILFKSSLKTWSKRKVVYKGCIVLDPAVKLVSFR